MRKTTTIWMTLGALTLLAGAARADGPTYVCTVELPSAGVVRLEARNAPLCGGQVTARYTVCSQSEQKARCDLRVSETELTAWFGKGLRAALAGAPLSLGERIASAR